MAEPSLANVSNSMATEELPKGPFANPMEWPFSPTKKSPMFPESWITKQMPSAPLSLSPRFTKNCRSKGSSKRKGHSCQAAPF